MFKHWKEMRALKKKNLLYTTAILSKVYGFMDSFPDIVEMGKKLQGLDSEEFQKGISEMIVSLAKDNDENSEE